MSVCVKICGITNVDDAIHAVELGADYLGFHFWPDSKHFVDITTFQQILTEVPYTIGKVGVFVNTNPQLVIDIATQFDLDLLQFQGDEKADYCNQLARPYIKTIQPKSEKDLEVLGEYEAEYFLINSFVQKSTGGKGVTSNWDLAKKAKEMKKNIFLSGGLTPENIEMAISSVKPFGVDVITGIELEPRQKDYHLMEEFIKKAKHILFTSDRV